MNALTSRNLIVLAALGSFSILMGAFAFQYIGGLAPCKLCIWQRWPHGAAILIGAVAVYSGRSQLAVLGAGAALLTAGFGIYHTGVERGWWEGPTSCTGGSGEMSGMTGSDLLNFDAAENIVMCDEVAWEMLGLSMASWNAVVSIGFAVLWVMALTRREI